MCLRLVPFVFWLYCFVVYSVRAVHSIKQVTNGGRGRVDVFTYKDRITKVVPWSILGKTPVQRIGTKGKGRST